MARHSNASSIVDYDDLVGYGTEGLIQAVDTFNPAYNVRFSTWAVMHIRTTIQDALRTLDPLPRSLRAKGKEIDRVSYELHDLSKRAKDLASAAVMLSLLLCAGVWGAALWHRLGGP